MTIPYRQFLFLIDGLIFCCGNLIFHQQKKKGNENDKKQFFLMKTMKSGKKVHENSK